LSISVFAVDDLTMNVDIALRFKFSLRSKNIFKRRKKKREKKKKESQWISFLRSFCQGFFEKK